MGLVEDITDWFLDTFEQAEELETLCRLRLQNRHLKLVSGGQKDSSLSNKIIETKLKSDPAFDLIYSANTKMAHNQEGTNEFLVNDNSKLLEKLALHLARHLGSEGIRLSGNFIYKHKDYMGWHTNSDDNTTKIYITYTLDEGKSSFDYMDRDRNIVVTPDRKGFTVRKFFTGNTPDTIFWHRVRSFTYRLSLGFTEWKPVDLEGFEEGEVKKITWTDPFYK